jgi:hypothetical protein
LDAVIAKSELDSPDLYQTVGRGPYAGGFSIEGYKCLFPVEAVVLSLCCHVTMVHQPIPIDKPAPLIIFAVEVPFYAV